MKIPRRPREAGNEDGSFFISCCTKNPLRAKKELVWCRVSCSFKDGVYGNDERVASRYQRARFHAGDKTTWRSYLFASPAWNGNDDDCGHIVPRRSLLHGRSMRASASVLARDRACIPKWRIRRSGFPAHQLPGWPSGPMVGLYGRSAFRECAVIFQRLIPSPSLVLEWILSPC